MPPMDYHILYRYPVQTPNVLKVTGCFYKPYPLFTLPTGTVDLENAFQIVLVFQLDRDVRQQHHRYLTEALHNNQYDHCIYAGKKYPSCTNTHVFFLSPFSQCSGVNLRGVLQCFARSGIERFSGITFPALFTSSSLRFSFARVTNLSLLVGKN